MTRDDKRPVLRDTATLVQEAISVRSHRLRYALIADTIHAGDPWKLSVNG